MMQSSIIGNVVGKAVDGVVKAYGYVCQYRLNMENLRTEITNLEDRREIIRRKVQEASERGEQVENAISHWQTKVDRQVGDAEQLMQQSTDNENMDSLACTRQRYGLSKQAEEMIADVKQLIHDSHFNEISHPRRPPAELEFRSNVEYVNFDSRKSIFNAIVNALNDPNVNMIGIHGLGGVGKTTLAKEVGQQKRHDGTFNQVPLVIVSSNLSVKEIQLKLADCLNFKFDAPGEQGRAKELWHRLKNGEKHLVILDDIWEGVDMKAIGIPIVDGNTGCKVLLTSRNEDLLLNKMKVHRNFTIAELPNTEAFTLFKEKVGNSIVCQPELHSLAEKVSKKCKGLPVAINALGAALKGKPVHAWRNALDKLERYRLTNIEGIHPSVWASLRVSYDMLQSPDAKSCFLLCCLYAEDVEISVDDLMRHCVARGLLCQDPHTFDEATNTIHTVVDTLKSSSLLLNASHEKVVRIHDVIRDVGIWIGREEKAFLVDHGALRWPRDSIRYLAISLRSGKIKSLPSEVTCPQLHTLILDNDKLSNLEVPDNFFNGMEKLTVLVLNRVRMRRLPSSLAKLTELRMLHLSECELEDIAILGDLKINLEVLSLRGSTIKALPQEIGQLTGLRLLDLQDCLYLKVIPQCVISHLTSLEELYFPYSFDNWKFANNGVNVSLEEVMSLLRIGNLTTLHINAPDVMLLPNESLMFESLKRFNITMSQFNMFYAANYKCLEKFSAILKLEDIAFQNNFIPLVNKAEFLTLIRVEDLENTLHLCSFNKLIELTISRCKIKYLFSKSIARGLIHLERLKVLSCEIMEEIVRFEGQKEEDEVVNMNKLKMLNLSYLPNLISFCAKKEKTETSMKTSSTSGQPLFNEKVIFPVLKKLSVTGLHNIVEIWDNQFPLVHENPESFSRLECVTVEDCTKLMNLAPSSMLGWLHNLQELSVEDCPNIESIISENGKEEEEEATDDSTLVIIPRLSTLWIWNVKNLNSFYSSSKRYNARCLFNNQVIFPVLKDLRIIGLQNIVEIWGNQFPLVHENPESFSRLECVSVKDCMKLMNLVRSSMLGRLHNLQDLSVQDCPNIESIISENGKEEEATDDSTLVIIPRLSSLCISSMKNLNSFYSSSKRYNARCLFNHQVIFPVLKKFHVSSLNNIVEIWQSPFIHENTESFSQLDKVTIKQCPKLMNLVPSNILPQLQTLEVNSCRKIESIVFENGKEEEKATDDSTSVIISQLTNLTIQNMENLKSFYSSYKRSNAQSLFNHQVIFPVLKELYVTGLHNIVEIWDNQFSLVHENPESFSRLERVTVEDCTKLMNLVPSSMLGWLDNLHDLRVQCCPNIESIISENAKEEEEEATDDSTLVIIPRLSTLWISDMKNLNSFYSSSKRYNARCLFNHQVIFPVLADLIVTGLDNIVDIWAKQSPLVHENAESFSQLEEVNVQTCSKLMHLIPSYMLRRLQNLKNLCVGQCPNIESIVFENGKEEEEEAGDNSTLAIIPQLTDLEIADMENLRSFYSSSKKSNAQSFFNHQVAFPALETLNIMYLPNVIEIWDKQPLSKLEQETESFYKLMAVDVNYCEQLAYVFPSYMLPQLQNNLQSLSITECEEMEVICSGEVKEKEAANNDIIVFHELKFVELGEGLDKLKSFYSGTQLFFFNEDAFPALMDIELNENLEIFKNGTSTKMECDTSRKRKQPYGEEGSMTLSLTDLASPSYKKAREERSLPPPSPLHHRSVKTSDSFSESCTNSGNSGDGGEIMPFGVKVKVDPMRKSMSMNNPSQYEQPQELVNVVADIAAGCASVDEAVHHQS